MNVLITGGAGFIGSNAAEYYLRQGARVTVFDNFTRAGSKKNLTWLQGLSGDLHVINGDIRHFSQIRGIAKEMKAADLVLHLAAQVAVTTSVINPKEDFEINVLGTIEVLEAMRKSASKAKLIYASTNKVYGHMETVRIKELKTRYAYSDLPHGIAEEFPLDFYSPYGCSKGSADQYIHDYSRIYDLDTVVFRQSCIYGPRQFGVEDQGWVAWFMIAVYMIKKITVYGDGKQVRDLLFIDDLVRAYDLAYRNKQKTKGNIYNIGGGYKNSLSIWSEFKPILERLFGRKIHARFAQARVGDQKIFISDNRKAQKDFGWQPQVSLTTGLGLIYEWIKHNGTLFSK